MSECILKKLSEEENILKYVLEEEGKTIGEIVFTEKEGTAEISYNIQSSFAGKGYETQIVSMGIKKARKDKPDICEYTGIVGSGDETSAEVFRLLGFDEIRKGRFTYFPGR